MTTMALKVNTTEYDFVDNCIFSINAQQNAMEIQIIDTSITNLQNAFDELIAANTIVEIGMFTSGDLSSATWKYSSVAIQSNPFLKTTESSSGTNYSLTFAITL